MYKVIFLIISSNNEPAYSYMREITPKYLDLYKDNIKYFFIENREDIEDEIVEDGNFLYIKGTESFIPGIYQKSMKSIEYITTKYDFEYVIRTNISSFWNMPNLLKFLEQIPKERFTCGYMNKLNDIYFLSGTGIIMSRDAGILLYKNYNNSHMFDDVVIGDSIIKLGITMYNIIEYKWGYLIPPYKGESTNSSRYLSIDENDFSDILYFRLKHDDRFIDVKFFKILLKKIYDIDIEMEL